MSFDANALMPTVQPEAATSETLPSENATDAPDAPVEEGGEEAGPAKEEDEATSGGGPPPTPERGVAQGQTPDLVRPTNKIAASENLAAAVKAMGQDILNSRKIGERIQANPFELVSAILALTVKARENRAAWEAACKVKGIKLGAPQKKRPELAHAKDVFRAEGSEPAKVAAQKQAHKFANVVSHLLTREEQGEALARYFRENGGLDGCLKAHSAARRAAKGLSPRKVWRATFAGADRPKIEGEEVALMLVKAAPHGNGFVCISTIEDPAVVQRARDLMSQDVMAAAPARAA